MFAGLMLEEHDEFSDLRRTDLGRDDRGASNENEVFLGISLFSTLDHGEAIPGESGTWEESSALGDRIGPLPK